MKKFSLWRWGRASDREQLEPNDAEQVVDSVTLGEETKKFGIRSYLHQFYMASPMVEEFDSPNAWYLLPPPPMQRTGVMCRVITLIGLLLLLAGAGLIIVGYTWQMTPTSDLDAELTRISITQDEDGDFFIDKEHLYDLLHPVNDKWRLAGFIVFAIGAGVIAVSLLIPSCIHFCASSKRLPFSGDNTPNEAPVKIYPSASGSRFKVTKLPSPHRISSSLSPVPVVQEISKVQPGASSKRSAGNSPTTEESDLLLISDAEPLLH